MSKAAQKLKDAMKEVQSKSEESKPEKVESKPEKVEPKPEESKTQSPKIIQVRVYQAVSFDGSTHTTFLVEGSSAQRIKPVEIKILPELLSVEIKSKTDHVLVPMTNVSGIYYENARYKARKASEKAEADKKAANSKALTDQSQRPR